MKLAIFRIILLVLFFCWILNGDEFYDFLIFVVFGILGIISIFNLLFLIIFNKKLGSYFASICYLNCCNRNSCEALGNKWTLKNNGVMVADIAGFGTNLHIYYIRQKNSYDVRTSVFSPPRYFSRFDCTLWKKVVNS